MAVARRFRDCRHRAATVGGNSSFGLVSSCKDTKRLLEMSILIWRLNMDSLRSEVLREKSFHFGPVCLSPFPFKLGVWGVVPFPFAPPPPWGVLCPGCWVPSSLSLVSALSRSMSSEFGGGDCGKFAKSWGGCGAWDHFCKGEGAVLLSWGIRIPLPPLVSP